MSAEEFPVIIAWSFGKRAFHQAAARLREQCEAFGYEHNIVKTDLAEHFARQPNPVWERKRWAYRFIPGFVLSQLNHLKRNVLYLHCDFQIQSPIPAEMFDGMDIGLESGWSVGRPKSVLASPIFVRNNDRARRFLKLWNSFCMNLDDGLGEHDHLRFVYKTMVAKDRTLRVGPFTPPLASHRGVTDTPIIGHK